MARDKVIARAPGDGRAAATVISLVLIGTTLSVLLRDPRAPGTDSYPLSTFPMFAARRAPQLQMAYAVGETAHGRVFLSPRMVGTGEVLQAKAMIDRAVGGGVREQTALCVRIAARVAGEPDFEAVTAIAIVTAKHDAVDFLVHSVRAPERTFVTCPVPGRAEAAPR